MPHAAGGGSHPAPASDLHDFVHRISHDLRSPLMAVLGFAELAEESVAADHPDDARLVGYLQRVVANARHMSDQLNALATLARVMRPIEPEVVFDLAPVLRVLSEAVEAPASVSVEVDTACRVEAPRDLFARMVSELLDNAVHHAGRDDVVVTVRALDADGGGLVLSVEDDGQGIPADQVPAALLPLQQLDPAPAGCGRTGMGLAIAREAARSLGGDLEIGSTATGGCRVAITLPSERLVTS